VPVVPSFDKTIDDGTGIQELRRRIKHTSFSRTAFRASPIAAAIHAHLLVWWLLLPSPSSPSSPSSSPSASLCLPARCGWSWCCWCGLGLSREREREEGHTRTHKGAFCFFCPSRALLASHHFHHLAKPKSRRGGRRMPATTLPCTPRTIPHTTKTGASFCTYCTPWANVVASACLAAWPWLAGWLPHMMRF